MKTNQSICSSTIEGSKTKPSIRSSTIDDLTLLLISSLFVLWSVYVYGQYGWWGGDSLWNHKLLLGEGGGAKYVFWSLAKWPHASDLNFRGFWPQSSYWGWGGDGLGRHLVPPLLASPRSKFFFFCLVLLNLGLFIHVICSSWSSLVFWYCAAMEWMHSSLQWFSQIDGIHQPNNAK